MNGGSPAGIGIGFNEAGRQTRDRTNCSLFHLYPSALSHLCEYYEDNGRVANYDCDESSVRYVPRRSRMIQVAMAAARLNRPLNAAGLHAYLSLSRPPWAYSLLRGVWLLLPHVWGKF